MISEFIYSLFRKGSLENDQIVKILSGNLSNFHNYITPIWGLMKSVSQPQRIFTVAMFLLLGGSGLLQAQTAPTAATGSMTAARDPGVRGGVRAQVDLLPG